MDKRIGAQYYTIRETCQTLEDFDESCRKVCEIGYKIVQLSGIGNFDGADIKKILDKYGLTCVCTHRPGENFLNNIEKEIEYHKTIGCKVCGIGCLPGIKWDDTINNYKELAEDFIKKFIPVRDKLKEHGLSLAYHNHSFEFEKYDGVYIFDMLQDAFGKDSFSFILDVYWLAFSGIDPAKFIREHKGEMICVHFKDLKIVQRIQKFAEVGNGNLDWDDIIAACDDAGVEYALVEQDTCDADPFDSLKISYDYLSKKGFN